MKFDWNLPVEELCDECGQPDNCGDCTHGPLSEQDRLILIGDSNA